MVSLRSRDFNWKNCSAIDTTIIFAINFQFHFKFCTNDNLVRSNGLIEGKGDPYEYSTAYN